MFGGTGVPDNLVASQLKDFILSLVIPPLFQLDKLDHEEVLHDLVCCLRYTYGTAEDRKIVETGWLPRLTGLPVLFATFVADAPSLAVTRSQVSIPLLHPLRAFQFCIPSWALHIY